MGGLSGVAPLAFDHLLGVLVDELDESDALSEGEAQAHAVVVDWLTLLGAVLLDVRLLLLDLDQSLVQVRDELLKRARYRGDTQPESVIFVDGCVAVGVGHHDSLVPIKNQLVGASVARVVFVVFLDQFLGVLHQVLHEERSDLEGSILELQNLFRV